MSGIAELLANLGYLVSGSDEKRSAVTDRLEAIGIRVAYTHDAANVGLVGRARFADRIRLERIRNDLHETTIVEKLPFALD